VERIVKHLKAKEVIDGERKGGDCDKMIRAQDEVDQEESE